MGEIKIMELTFVLKLFFSELMLIILWALFGLFFSPNETYKKFLTGILFGLCIIMVITLFLGIWGFI